ncbi:hypothetical protein Tco_0648804 [Tanacetum coccineum]
MNVYHIGTGMFRVRTSFTGIHWQYIAFTHVKLQCHELRKICTTKLCCVGGKTSIELPFDPNIPALEDDRIFDFSIDNKDDSIVADMNNLDTKIQVSPNLTTRIHKDHPLDQVIGDLQSATQTRKMSKNMEEHGFLVLFNKEQPIKTFKTACLLAFYHRKNPKR